MVNASNATVGRGGDAWLETVNTAANVTLLLFFVVGISGNVWVLTLLARSHRRLFAPSPAAPVRSRGHNDSDG